METFTIPSRFCGPPTSGNGGYACGLLARGLEGPVECTLRSPIPLRTPLYIESTSAGAVLRNTARVIIEANSTTLNIEPPAPVNLEAATEVGSASPALDPRHPFPTCFVCGPKRDEADGLRIFPAPLNGNLYAATWLPAAEFGNAGGDLKPEFLWAALDCPTGFAAGFPAAGTLVTGQMAVKQLGPVRVNEPCVLLSWPLGIEGRKHFSAACLYQHDVPRAVARATWIRLEG